MAAAVDMDTLQQQSQQQRLHSWNNNNNPDLHNAINKLNVSYPAAAAAIIKGTGCGYDVVSMDMEDPPSSADMYGLHSAHAHGHGRVLLGHSHAGTGGSGAGLVPTSMMLPNFVHHSLNKGLSSRKYPCKMCSQVFESKTEYQMHIQSHMREPKPYKCSQCPKSFANSSYLSQHMRIHLGIKPYHCEICKKKFTQLSHLQQHIRTHTGDKPYKCHHSGCNKAFSQLSNLQSHSRCHQTDKPHKCNSCYKCFYDETALQEHIPKHKDSKHLKTHICSYCGKSYTQETYLARHMAKHSDKMDKQRCANAAALAHVKTSGDIYWPKQEDITGAHHRLSQEELYGSATYNAYTNSYGNPHMGQYAGPGAGAGYDLCMPTKNTCGSTSAFSAALSNASRGGLYYPDQLGGLNAMKTHNINGLSTEGHGQGKSASSAAASHQVGVESYHAFNVQHIRNYAGFPGMPTMLQSDSSFRKQQRF